MGKGCKNKKESAGKYSFPNKRSYLILEHSTKNAHISMQHFYLSVYWSSNNVIKGKVSLIYLGYKVKCRSPSPVWWSHRGPG